MTKLARELEEYDVEYEMHKFSEGSTHASPESDKPSMSSNIEALRVEGEGKPHFGDSKTCITLANPRENKHLIEPSFKYEVDDKAKSVLLLRGHLSPNP